MEPSKDNRKKWVIFGVIIAVLAILVAVGPVIITRVMRSKTQPKSLELMIKVKGVVKKTQDADANVFYLKGNNNLYYVLLTNREGKEQQLESNLEKEVTVFGNIVHAEESDTIAENPVRMKIDIESITASEPNQETH
jgi:uncharacterized protein YpmB